jgi:3-deoxy-D-manno-octulosonate 8-phosphate phosphatase (KDO 8-P phosphatase)
MIFNNKSYADNAAAEIKLIIADNDGTLTPGHTFYSKEGEELKMYCHKDGRGVYLLKKAGLKFGIITGEGSEIVKRRAEKLNADFVILKAENKVLELKKILKKFNFKENQVAYIGDDTNDLEIMNFVGLSIAVNDAHKDVVDVDRADIICKKSGGCGAFREAVDYVLSHCRTT